MRKKEMTKLSGEQRGSLADSLETTVEASTAAKACSNISPSTSITRISIGLEDVVKPYGGIDNRCGWGYIHRAR